MVDFGFYSLSQWQVSHRATTTAGGTSSTACFDLTGAPMGNSLQVCAHVWVRVVWGKGMFIRGGVDRGGLLFVHCALHLIHQHVGSIGSLLNNDVRICMCCSFAHPLAYSQVHIIPYVGVYISHPSPILQSHRLPLHGNTLCTASPS